MSLPLTGLVLIVGLLLALMAVAGGAPSRDEEAVPALEQPEAPSAPALGADEAVERKLERALRLAVVPGVERVYVLQPVQLLSLRLPGPASDGDGAVSNQ